MKTSHLIFDLGGVIVDTRDSDAIDYLRSEGITNADQLFNRNTAHCIAYETGKISSDQFIQAVANQAEIHNEPHKTLDVITAAWLNIIAEIPYENIRLLKSLRAHYPLHVLSTNNELHAGKIAQLCQEQYHCDFFSLFNKVHLSHKTGIAKPRLEAFEFLLQEIGQPPEVCLFIDDRVENILAAQQLGIQTLHIDHPEKLLELKNLIM